MNVTPFGAKSPTDTVVGVSADANGNINTKKKWENNAISLEFVSETPLTTVAAYSMKTIDLSDAACVSIRIKNTMNIACDLVFYNDSNSVGTTNVRLYDSEGNLIKHNIPSGGKIMIITPDDIPQLAWLNTLSVGISIAEVPSSGTVAVSAVIKR